MRRLSALLLILCVACAHRSSAADLVGTWRLVEYWDAPDGGQKQYPFGEHPLGFFVYDRAGNVLIQIARNPQPSRVSQEQRARLGATELVAMIEGYVAYFGTYTIDAARGVVIHHVTADVRREYTGTDQPRPFRLDGDVLTIGDSRKWLRRLVRVK